MKKRAHLDTPRKEIIEHFFQHLLEFCLPKIAKEIDWSRGYEFLDKELRAITRNQKIGKRIVDKLVFGLGHGIA